MNRLPIPARRWIYGLWFRALRRVAVDPPRTRRTGFLPSPSEARLTQPRSLDDGFCGAASPEGPAALAAQMRALAQVSEGRRQAR